MNLVYAVNTEQKKVAPSSDGSQPYLSCFCVAFKIIFLPVVLYENPVQNVWETCMQWAEMQKQQMGGAKRGKTV